MAHSPTRRGRRGSRGRARRTFDTRGPRAERVRDVQRAHRRDGARGCRRARVKRFSRRRAHDASAVMPHTSWGARWPPLHAVHGGEGYDGESEMSDAAFLKRKRDDAKDALRARGEPFARHSRCKHRGCASTSARMPNARSRDARTRADDPVQPVRREPARVETRDIVEYLRSRERGADASKRQMRCVPRPRRPTFVMSHHLHLPRVFAREKQTTTRARLTEPSESAQGDARCAPDAPSVRHQGTNRARFSPPAAPLRTRVRDLATVRLRRVRTSFPRRDPDRFLRPRFLHPETRGDLSPARAPTAAVK